MKLVFHFGDGNNTITATHIYPVPSFHVLYQNIVSNEMKPCQRKVIILSRKLNGLL